MSIITVIRSIPAGVRSFVKAARTEYRALAIDRAQALLEKQDGKYEQMTEEERKQADADTAAILARAAELRTRRQTPKYYFKRDAIAERKAKTRSRKAR